MKKKHFLFTSLTIAAILSANVAYAEEGTTTVSEPENERIMSEENKSEQPSTDPQAEENQALEPESSHRSVPDSGKGLDVPLGSSEQPGVEVTVERIFDQTAVREEALKAVRELREEMWDINPLFNGKKLQDVVKETGFQGKEDYAQALEWDNELEAYAVQRSVEVSYVWAHERPDGSGALDSAPEKVHGENLSMGYPTVTAAIKTSWGYGELEALNANQGFSNSANGHLHNQLNPQFKSFAVGVSGKHYAQSLSWAASEHADGIKLDGKHTIKLKVTEDLAKHEDFVKKENPKQEVPKPETPKQEVPKSENPKSQDQTGKETVTNNNVQSESLPRTEKRDDPLDADRTAVLEYLKSTNLSDNEKFLLGHKVINMRTAEDLVAMIKTIEAMSNKPFTGQLSLGAKAGSGAGVGTKGPLALVTGESSQVSRPVAASTVLPATGDREGLGFIGVGLILAGLGLVKVRKTTD